MDALFIIACLIFGAAVLVTLLRLQLKLTCRLYHTAPVDQHTKRCTECDCTKIENKPYYMLKDRENPGDL
jgi:hypothetical protein